MKDNFRAAFRNAAHRTALGALALVLTGCSGGHYLMQLLEEHDGTEWVYISDGCVLVADDGSRSESSAGPAGEPDEDHFAIETQIVRGVAKVTISTASQSIDLEFDEDDLESGEETTTEVTTDAGTRYRITHWGSEECELRPEERGMGGESSD